MSGLVLNFVPDPTAALDAMRTAAPTGVIAAYVWDYAGRMGLIRHFWDAAVALNPRQPTSTKACGFQSVIPTGSPASGKAPG